MYKSFEGTIKIRVRLQDVGHRELFLPSQKKKLQSEQKFSKQML